LWPGAILFFTGVWFASTRMKRIQGGDPFLGVLEDRPDLIGALERLLQRTG
jgi:hypothetical protein